MTERPMGFNDGHSGGLGDSGGLNGGRNDGGGDSGLPEMSPEDFARLRLKRGHNFYALNNEADLDMLLSQSAQAGKVTVVDYYAPWCRACQKLLKGMQKMASDAEFGSVNFASVDFEQARELCKMKKVEKLPTLEIYRSSEVTQRWSGANKKRLLERLTTEMGMMEQEQMMAAAQA